jgi:hypothetical protein
VASSTAGLVIASKNVANHCESQQGVNEVISLVTQCALSTSQLVSCTKVCSSTIGSRECQEQVIEAARQVSRQVDAVVDVAAQHCRNEQAINELRVCAKNVTDAVIHLLNNVKALNEKLIANAMGGSSGSDGMDNTSAMGLNDSSNGIIDDEQLMRKQDESIEKIFNATDCLFGCMGDSAEMIRQAKILAQVYFPVFFNLMLS